MSANKLRPWKTLSREVILNPNKFLTVERRAIELPDGQIIDDWPFLISPDAAIILARTEAGQFICFRQTKYAIEGTTLAVAGGMMDPGESPLAAAKRELLEETGYTAPEWINLGSYVLDPNRGLATINLFLALDASAVAEPDSDDLEDQELVLLNQRELESALEAGGFKLLSWATVVALALKYLAERQ